MLQHIRSCQQTVHVDFDCDKIACERMTAIAAVYLLSALNCIPCLESEAALWLSQRFSLPTGDATLADVWLGEATFMYIQVDMQATEVVQQVCVCVRARV